ncbi:MAG: GAF domain-containing protein, partial [Woeseiaceae bacterium]
QVAVEYGEFHLAWIGLADPATETVRPVAFAGEESGFLAGLTVSLRDVPEGRGPTGTAIRKGRHVVCNDVRNDPRMAPWREVALSHGHGATAAFPLFVEGRPIAALCVHAESPGYFGDEEVKLLDEVASDISFALEQFSAQGAKSRLAAIVESSEDAIIGTDRDGNVKSWNAGAEKIFGYAAAEMLGRSIERLVAHKRNADYDQRVSRILRGEAPASFETSYVHKDGHTIDVSVCVSNVRDAGGKGVGLSIVGRDISERKRSEEKLHFHEALLRETGRIAKVGGWQFDVATGEGFWTEEVARIHDLDPDAPTSREIGLRFFEDESRSRIEAAIEAAIRHGTPYDLELQITTAAGVRKWVRSIGHPVVEDGKVVRLRGTFQDITNRKRAERRQETRNAVSRALAESANLSEATPKIMEAICESEGWDFGAVWELDEDSKVLRCAEVWYRPQIVAVELAERTRAEEFAPGEGLPGSVWATVRGSLIPDVTAPGAYSRASGAAEAGMRSALAFPILLRGEVTGVLEFLGSEIHDTDDALIDMFRVIGEQVGAFFERKRFEADARKLEQQLNQAQKMEAIGQLSGGIAHDFNNILSAIYGHVHLAGRNLPTEHPVQKNLNGIANAGNRAKDLVRRILTFSRDQEPERSVISLQPIVDEVVQLLRASLPAMIEIRTSFADDAPEVYADATQVHQVLMNLATNAKHAMAGDDYGTLDIRLESVTVDEDMADMAPDLNEGRYARLSISDTGCGMDEATLKRVFEPFFTTKGPREGTGLGLAVVHGIMKSHEGSVTVYSQPGHGTMFRLYFPMAAAHAAEVRRPSTGPAQGRGEHILFVDNEEPLVFIGTRILTRLGYRVTGFTNAVQALRAFLDDPNGFDVLVSDCSMPQMTGFDLAADALRVRPDLPVILASGFVRPQDREAAQRIGVTHLIVKPATVDEFAQQLREVLDAVKPG